VGEGEDHLVNQLIRAEGARNRLQRRIGRHLRDEVLRVEAAQSRLSVAAGQRGTKKRIEIANGTAAERSFATR
jgi:hypothetical protein